MIPRTKKIFPTKKIIIASSVVSLLALSAVTYVYAFNGNIFGWTNARQDTSNPNKTIEAQKKAGEQIRQNSTTTSTDTKSVTSGSDQPPSPQPVQGSTKKSVDLVFTADAQIRSIIYVVSDTGTCTLTLTKTGSSTVTKTAQVQALSSSSTCRGFDIPVSELSKGQWNASIYFENTNYTASATKTISVN